MKIGEWIKSRWAALAHDLLMIPIAWFGAYWLRFNLEVVPDGMWRDAEYLLPIVFVAQGGMLWYFGLYRGIWRFASLPDLVRIVKAVVVGVSISAVVIFMVTRFETAPRSVFVLDSILLVFLLGGPRMIYRWARDRHLYRVEGERVLVVGAGGAGEVLVRDMLRDGAGPYRPMALVDDNPNKVGKEIHGVRVAGKCIDIPVVVSRYEIDAIVIAIPSATGRDIRRIVEICETTRLPFRILPHVDSPDAGHVSLRDLRDVRIEDLLGRETVELDWQAIARAIHGKTIFVTGAGGSIGAELCRQIARLGPARLVVFDHSEFSLYEIERELHNRFASLPVVAVLGDVCDAVAVESAFRTHRPSVVFHAAAYKHVPILQGQVRTAVLNNAIGTRTVAQTAEQFECETFILISSDKAVNPTNVMGATKRVAELICQELARRSNTKFITVRFGNVLGSSGSVIPLFQQQIRAGGPVTVTHRDVQRYFMTIPESCQLILQACALGRGGEIFVLNMGEPVKIAYLAEQLIRLSGKIPGEDVRIVYTGLRVGEKLNEELFYSDELHVDTAHPKIFQAQSRPVDDALLRQTLINLERGAREGDEDGMRLLLDTLLPDKLGARTARPSAVVFPIKSLTANNSSREVLSH